VRQRRSILSQRTARASYRAGQHLQENRRTQKNIGEVIPYRIADHGQSDPKNFHGLFEIRAWPGNPKNFLGINPTERRSVQSKTQTRKISLDLSIRPGWPLSVQYCQTRKISTDLNAAQCNRLRQRDGAGIRRFAN
jgi:hypothetical protein